MPASKIELPGIVRAWRYASKPGWAEGEPEWTTAHGGQCRSGYYRQPGVGIVRVEQFKSYRTVPQHMVRATIVLGRFLATAEVIGDVAESTTEGLVRLAAKAALREAKRTSRRRKKVSRAGSEAD